MSVRSDEPAGHSTARGFRPDIEGLRAVAVLAVVLFHAGVPGLETTLPLLLTAVHEGRLSLERLVELLYDGPRRIYGLPAQPETRVDVDPERTYVLGQGPLYTKCGWTPFAGMRVRGRVSAVTLRGKQVYADRAWKD